MFIVAFKTDIPGRPQNLVIEESRYSAKKNIYNHFPTSQCSIMMLQEPRETEGKTHGTARDKAGAVNYC